MKATKYVLLVLAIFALTVGCAPDKNETALRITFGDQTNARTLTPDVSMDVDSYTVHITGPSNRDVTGITGSSVVIRFLDPGAYTVAVDAFNAEAVKIGEGSNTCDVAADTQTDITVDVYVVVGIGSFDETVAYRSDIADSSIAASVLKHGESEPIDLPLDITQDGAFTAHANIDLDSGWYVSTTMVKSGANIWAGLVEALRIVKGFTSYLDIDWTNTGQIGLVINPHIAQPLVANITGVAASYSLSDDLAGVKATVDGFDAAQIHFYWYVDSVAVLDGEGLAQGWTSAYLNEYGLTPSPNHTLSVIVHNLGSNLRYGSETVEFELLP